MRYGRTGWLLIGPTVILMTVIGAFPLLYAAYISMCDWHFYESVYPIKFVFLDNYIKQWLHEPRFLATFITTAWFAVFSVTTEFLLGLGLAILMTQKFKGRGVVRVALLTPMMLPSIVVGIIGRFMIEPRAGFVNYLLGLLRLPPFLWSSSPQAALFAIVAIDVWQWTPFMALVLLAGLTSVSPTLYEAADIDGASMLDKLRYITLPMIKPVIGIALMFRVADAFKTYETIKMTTYGGPAGASRLIVFAIDRWYYTTSNFGATASACISLLVVLVLIILVFIWYTRRTSY